MTVHFSKVPNFHLLSQEEAEKILYDELLPACEKQGVYLAPEGNLAYTKNLERYEECKRKKTTFSVTHLQNAFPHIGQVYCDATQYRQISKPLFEERVCYISGGELMALMMLHGYSARFQKRNSEDPSFRAEFQVKEVRKRILGI